MFPENSAFYSDDQRARESREADLLHPPLRTPEGNRKVADPITKTANIHVSTLEDWIDALDRVVDESSPQELFDTIDQMRSHLSG